MKASRFVPMIGTLRLGIRPATVIAGITEVIVDAIERALRRSHPHVQHENLEGLPSRVVADTAPTIEVVVRVLRAVAAPFQGLPRPVGWIERIIWLRGPMGTSMQSQLAR